MTITLSAYSCPHCGNTNEQEGITHCFLEWRITPVEGQDDGKVYVDFELQEGSDVGTDEDMTAKNVPKFKPDLEHFYCNGCGWRWFDNERKTEDVQCFHNNNERKAKFDAALERIRFGQYHEVRFIRDFKGWAYTTQYSGPDDKELEDPIRHPVDVSYPRGTKLRAGICNTGNGKLSLEIEGFDYGVGHLHGLTWEDIEIEGRIVMHQSEPPVPPKIGTRQKVALLPRDIRLGWRESDPEGTLLRGWCNTTETRQLWAVLGTGPEAEAVFLGFVCRTWHN